jgi:hypothetical protein
MAPFVLYVGVPALVIIAPVNPAGVPDPCELINPDTDTKTLPALGAVIEKDRTVEAVVVSVNELKLAKPVSG